MTDEKLEKIAEAVHNAWWQEKIKQGVTDHPDMLPYSELSEEVKEYDRVTARAVLHNLPNLSTWIPVEEQSPEDRQTVLASNGRYVYLVEYDADLDAPFGDMDDIVAWMPLPEPYTPDKENN